MQNKKRFLSKNMLNDISKYNEDSREVNVRMKYCCRPTLPRAITAILLIMVTLGCSQSTQWAGSGSQSPERAQDPAVSPPAPPQIVLPISEEPTTASAVSAHFAPEAEALSGNQVSGYISTSSNTTLLNGQSVSGRVSFRLFSQ